MKKKIALGLCALFLVAGCGPVKLPVTNQYKLESYARPKQPVARSTSSILVSMPEALAGYQTEQMHYVAKPFELSSFAHNDWISPPANMLYPLILQSLQASGYFYAVVSGPYVSSAEYRLDTQLISLQQNFLVRPSVMELVVKTMLTHIGDNRVLTTHTFSEHVACPQDTPYGGVIAANRASQNLTAKLSYFVIKQIVRDRNVAR